MSAAANEDVPATGNKEVPGLTSIPAELIISVLEQIELIDLLSLRQVCRQFDDIVKGCTLKRVREVISQRLELKEKRLYDTARLLIAATALTGESGNERLQSWRKKVVV